MQRRTYLRSIAGLAAVGRGIGIASSQKRQMPAVDSYHWGIDRESGLISITLYGSLSAPADGRVEVTAVVELSEGNVRRKSTVVPAGRSEFGLSILESPHCVFEDTVSIRSVEVTQWLE